MVMDFYEMSMANGYFHTTDYETTVAFDVFYRKNPDNAGFSIFAGLAQIIEYINGLHFEPEDIAYLRAQGIFSEDFLTYLKDYHFRGDMYAMPEGTIVYPNEPLITVVAPLIDAQLIETALLLEVNHQSLIATKTSRIVRMAGGRAVSDFGARRAHNVDAAVYGARAAYIGGASGTATVLAGEMFGIPVSGTMAHSWVMYFENEYEAFKKYAETYPDSTVLLVDTYNVRKSGVPNAIRVAKEVLEPMGKRLKGIRIDSGDLAFLSKEARRMLDEAGMTDCRIVASNGLDEYTIKTLIDQGAEIDSFGVGEHAVVSNDHAAGFLGLGENLIQSAAVDGGNDEHVAAVGDEVLDLVSLCSLVISAILDCDILFSKSKRDEVIFKLCSEQCHEVISELINTYANLLA